RRGVRRSRRTERTRRCVPPPIFQTRKFLQAESAFDARNCVSRRSHVDGMDPAIPEACSFHGSDPAVVREFVMEASAHERIWNPRLAQRGWRVGLWSALRASAYRIFSDRFLVRRAV